MSAPSPVLGVFIEEANEHLDACDRSILALDAALCAAQAPASEDIQTLFRAMHTIKGNAGMLGLDELVAAAHALETALGRMRDGSLAVSRELLDVMFAGIDAMRTAMVMLEQGQSGGFSAQALVSALAEVLPGAGAAGAAWQSRFDGWTCLDEPEAPTLLAGLDAGRIFLFRLTARLAPAAASLADPALEKLTMLGHVLAWKPTEDGQLTFAFATSATPDIVERFQPEVVTTLTAWAPEASDAPPTPAPAAVQPAVASEPAEHAEASIRVGVPLLDRLMNMVGELVLVRNQLLQQVQASGETSLQPTAQRLNALTSELQEAVMLTRMQPVGQVWDKFPRLVRDYCRTSGKQVKLVMEGADTELDKSLLETIKDPLTHLVRNALDHGCEAAEARVAANKPATAVVTLLAYHNGGQIVIEIKDDGRGLNEARIREKALDQGIVSQEQLRRMTRSELLALIFHPGFSTAEAVTAMSGRGVGMDVVKSNIERIGGTIDIQSEPGCGTTIRLRIPLTLAVIPALVIRCGAERFAIPQATVLEVVQLGSGFQAIEQIRDSRLYRLRDALIPVLGLRELLGRPQAASARHLVVLQVGPMVFGLAVDAIGDTEEIVVKNLPRFLQALGVYAGVTIMGDGRASLILDVAGLLQAGGLESQNVAEPEPETEVEADGTFQRMLLARLGERVYAVPMGLVSRLEEFPASRLEQVGDRAVLQYGRDLLPIVEPHAVLGLAAPEGDRLQVVVFGEGKRKVGLRVDAILDVVEDHMAIHPVIGAAAVIGAAVIHGRTTELLDVHHVIGAAMPGWSPGAGNGDGKTILLVEDSAFFRSLVRSHLEGQGYRILEAGNGEEGLKVFARQPVDLVLSDIEMPRVDGLAFVKRLRALETGRRVPAIALTSVTSDETRQAALTAGFDRYLAKYDREAVMDVLADLQPMEELAR